MSAELRTALAMIANRPNQPPPYQFAVLQAPADDTAYLPALLADIAALPPPPRVLLVEAPARGPQEPLRRLLAVLAPALQVLPPRQGRETHRIGADVLRQLPQHADLLVVDHAERLGYAALNFLRRGHPQGMVPVLLVSRDAAALDEVLQEEGLWMRAWLVPATWRPSWYAAFAARPA